MQSRQDIRRTKRRAAWPWTLAIVGAFVLMGASSSPASADSNFERGFEDQMGRILAYEAVNLGKHVLVQGLYGPAHAYRSPHPGRGYDHYDRRPARRHWRHERYRHPVAHRHAARHPQKHHWKHRKHHRHHRHDRHCDHDVSYHYYYD